MLKADERVIHAVSHLVCNARDIVPDPGTIHGECSICGLFTKTGHEIDVSNNFMAWEHFDEGSNVCAPCWHMLNESKYRRSSWFATPDTFSWLSREEIRPILLDLPSGLWALYITLSYRKHGWLQTHVNTSQNRFVLTVDDEEFPLTKSKLENTIEKVRKAAVFIGGSEEKIWKGRWLWLKDEHLLTQRGQMAIQNPELYEWFKAHRFDGLVKALVSVMVPTKTEMKKK